MEEYKRIVHNKSGNLELFNQAEFPNGKYKILIPKGTQRWYGVTVAWKSEQPSNAWMKMDSPPARTGGPMSDSSRSMERLWNGETLHAQGIPFSQILSMSQPGSATAWRATSDRWLYIDVEFSEGRAQQWSSRIEIDPAYVPAPTPPAPPTLPDPPMDLALRTLTYAQASGLVTALSKMSKATNDTDFIVWVAAQDDLWFSICRLTGLAEKKK